MLTADEIDEIADRIMEPPDSSDAAEVDMDRLLLRRFARAVLAAEKAKAEPVWISVEERLPEKFTEVLIAFEDCTLPATGQYTGSVHDPNGWSYPWENHGDGYDWTVTHWMELPPTPKELADAAPPHPEHQGSER